MEVNGNGHSKPVPQIVIQINPLNGEVAFETNVPSSVMFYGMLEAARDAYAELKKNNASRIVTLPGVTLPKM